MAINTYDHLQVRDSDKFLWGTFGKYGDKSVRWIKVCDLSDSHLLHIIEHIQIHMDQFGEATLKLMRDEARYRTVNHIFIDEYDYDELDYVKAQME